jgi:DNA (cytosine-5)-methyltransferase 1
MRRATPHERQWPHRPAGHIPSSGLVGDHGLSSRYSVVDLFSGCGGFSRGFERTGRFETLVANDIKRSALATFRLNHGDRAAVLHRDIRTVSIDELRLLLADRGVNGEGELDCLIGGPPCQGFSQLRRSEDREGSEIVRFGGYSRMLRDDRNDLVLRFLEVAAALKPKVVLIENVSQMLKHAHNGRRGDLAELVVELLAEMGYEVNVSVLVAADYGVPQLRERAFFYASRVYSPVFPAPTHTGPASPKSEGAAEWVTVREAIGDLPPPPERYDSLGGCAPTETYLPSLSTYATQLRSTRAFPYNHVSRRYSPRIMRIIREMRPGATWDDESARMRRQYEILAERERAEGEPLEAALARLKAAGVVNEAFYQSYYWSAYTRLAWERPALTITANANFLGSGRFTHPDQDRGITMREAARLQSFDDDFVFLTSDRGFGTTNFGVAFDLIGEAVPPALAHTLALQIASQLDAVGTVSLAERDRAAA